MERRTVVYDYIFKKLKHNSKIQLMQQQNVLLRARDDDEVKGKPKKRFKSASELGLFL